MLKPRDEPGVGVVEGRICGLHGHRGLHYSLSVERPTFVKNGGPDDRAYGFFEGDLRGIHSLFVPDTSADGTS